MSVAGVSFFRLVASVSVWDDGRRLSGCRLGIVKRVEFGYLLGSTGRVTGEPKARHSHLKPVLLTLFLLLVMWSPYEGCGGGCIPK